MTASDYQQRRNDRVAALLIPCPTCHAEPNMPCRAWHGPTRFPHTHRQILVDPIYRAFLDGSRPLEVTS